MRYAIETAPTDGTIVILEDDTNGTYDVVHWSAEAGEWVGENDEPSKITPTHWSPMLRDKYLLQEHDGSSNRSKAGLASRARRGFAAITATFIVAALIGLYFEQQFELSSQDLRETHDRRFGSRPRPMPMPMPMLIRPARWRVRMSSRPWRRPRRKRDNH